MTNTQIYIITIEVDGDHLENELMTTLDSELMGINREGIEVKSIKRLTSEMTKQEIKIRLEYFRGEIEAERISASEVAELERLAEHIEPGDNLLLQWAGVPEGTK